MFIETKIWISDYGYDETLHGFEKGAKKLGVDQIDRLILHQALPSEFGQTREAYRALETLVRAFGPRPAVCSALMTRVGPRVVSDRPA